MPIIAKTLDKDAMKISIAVQAATRLNGKRKSKTMTAQVLVTRKQLKWVLSKLKASRDSIIANIPVEQ